MIVMQINIVVRPYFSSSVYGGDGRVSDRRGGFSATSVIAPSVLSGHLPRSFDRLRMRRGRKAMLLHSRHSGAGRNPVVSHTWIPTGACPGHRSGTGVTETNHVFARFIRAIHPSRLAVRAPQDEGAVRALLDFRDKPGNDIRRHTEIRRYSAEKHIWTLACAGLTVN